MTIQEILNLLVKATQEEYVQYRMQINDSFMNFIEDMLPNDYEYIQEKEEFYQKHKELIKLMYNIKESNEDTD